MPRVVPGVLEVLLVFTRLGLTSFGGPVAHLGYFRAEFVTRRGWLTERDYADLVALCQFLPGPASSQVGLAIGLNRAGLPGALAAWVGFTLPSAALLVLFALGVGGMGEVADSGWLRGLKIVVVAVVAQAVLGLARTLTPDVPRALLALLAAILVLVFPDRATQVLVIIGAGVIGWRLLPPGSPVVGPEATINLPRRLGGLFLAVFFGLLVGLPLAREAFGGPAIALFDSFYRAGSLVFGGGHVVLPLLEAEVVPPGWVTREAFIAGYGAAQAVPGPLFTFSAYLGAVSDVGLGPVRGAAVALIAIFLPSFLLVAGTLPYWNAVRVRPGVQSVLRGVNAAIVGILLAALYTPVFTTAVATPLDFALVLAAFALLEHLRLPPWLVVGVSALAGFVLFQLGG